MTWCTIAIELEHNKAGAPAHHRFLLHAPLDSSGRIDSAAFDAAPHRAWVEEQCGDPGPKHGHLMRRDDHRWCFCFEETEQEPIYLSEDNVIALGAPLIVRDLSGKELNYCVTRVTHSADVKTLAQDADAAGQSRKDPRP